MVIAAGNQFFRVIMVTKLNKKEGAIRWIWLLILLVGILNFPVYSQTTPGVSVFGSKGYVEYIPGDLPIVISVPHGGYLEPASIPDRDCDGCVYGRDSYTQELARSMNVAFYEQMGGHAHFVINLLARRKFDANRDLPDAADGNATVGQAWVEYHDFINTAKSKIEADYTRGLFIDLHGHGHEIQRLELGYLLSGSELRMSSSVINSSAFINESSIRTLVSDNRQSLTHLELLRGSYGFGTIIDRKGYPAVPSLNDKYPIEGQPFFNGGYNTRRHSSIEGGNIDGFQIECNQSIRFDSSKRNKFAEELTRALNEYYDLHYDDDYILNNDYLITGLAESNSIETISVFPNPATSEINVKSDIKNVKIEVFNILGKHEASLIWQGQSIDISFLPKGYYILKFNQHNGFPLRPLRLIKY